MKRAATKKKNPGIADMAALANAVFTTMQIHDHMTKKAPKKKRSTAKRRRNPETQTQINARMAKVRAARKANPKPKATINGQRSTINPRKRVTVPSKGRFYLMTIGSGDDTLGVFINDRDGDGISKKFKTVAAAKAYATKNRLTLENPAKPEVVKLMPGSAVKRSPTDADVRRAREGFSGKIKVNPTTARVYHSRTFGGWVVTVNGLPLYPKRNGDWTVYPTLVKAKAVAKVHAVKVTVVKRKVNPVVIKKSAAVTKRRPNPVKKAVATKKANPLPKSKAAIENRLKVLRRRIKRLEAKDRSVRGKLTTRERALLNEGSREMAVLARKQIEAGRHPGVRFNNPAPKKTVVKKANPAISQKGVPRGYKIEHDFGRYIVRNKETDRAIGSGSTRSIALQGARAYLASAKKRNPTPVKKAVVRKNPPKTPRSRLFENFQGRTASTVRSLETSHHLGSERLIQLGKLHEIKLVGMNPIRINPNRVVLCATPKGKLAIAGQRFAKKNPGMKSNEISFLGEIEHVVYETHKPHHGDRPNQLYIHELGEVTGQRPKLYADHLGFPIVKGGAYSVRPEGIVN